jgi:hypothetical protein
VYSLRQVVLPFSPQRSGVFFLNADSFIVVDRTGTATNKHNQQTDQRLQPAMALIISCIY